MKTKSGNAIALFFSGFFAKDIIDDIFFLMIDKYPIDVFGFQITAASHKMMLVVSTILTAVFLYFGLRKNKNRKESTGNA